MILIFCLAMFIPVSAQFNPFQGFQQEGPSQPFRGPASGGQGMGIPMGFDAGPFDGYEGDSEVDSGNWYEKLHWWKEAKRVYTVDIHDAMEQMKLVIAEYDKKKTTLLEHLGTYYKSIPVERTAAPGIIIALIDETKKEQESLSEPTTPEQRVQSAKLEEQLKGLETLKNNFDQFNGLIQLLLRALNEVYPQQVQVAQSYDERALKDFERIENVYDDEKAQNYFDSIENGLENIRDISTYLIGPLNIFIDQVWAKLQQLMPGIKKSVEDFERQGIPIRILTEKEKAERAELAKKKEEARKKAEAEKKEEEARKKISWWQKLFAAIGSFFRYLYNSMINAFSSIGGWFGGAKKAEPEAKPKQQPKSPSAAEGSSKPVTQQSGKVPALPGLNLPKIGGTR